MQLVAWNLAGGSFFFRCITARLNQYALAWVSLICGVWRPVKAAVVVIDQFVGASLSITIIIIHYIIVIIIISSALFIHHIHDDHSFIFCRLCLLLLFRLLFFYFSSYNDYTTIVVSLGSSL